ncbi:MAG: family 78 glycoside hydrolase catalytic domain [Clostridia bacterium]|nr:family 78 glycoside hydrolase catalytic domain [Clostridia bacterium]
MMISKHFVCATKEYNTLEYPVPNPQFRKKFHLTSLPKVAEITICGLGYYELYLNGQNITKGVMAPYRSNPDHFLYYDRYDITELLTVGENVIGILLGNGFLNSCHPVWDFDQAPYRSAPKVALSVTTDKGVLFESDQLVCTESPLIREDFHCGECYDARLELDGWKNPGYDDRNWRPALPAECPKGEVRFPDCEPIGIVDVHYPVRIIPTARGFIYDFVVNCAGLCELKIKGSPGQKISLLYGELIRDGQVDQRNIRFEHFVAEKDEYILRGGKTETYMPHFTYHGFRFVEVIGITAEQATPDLLTFYEMSSSLKQLSDFQCDNADINAIYDSTQRSNRANFMYFPTDCPHREKNGWTGDIALSAEQLLIQYDCVRSLKEWCRNVWKAQNELGAIPGIVPTDTWGFDWGNGPAWDLAMFEVPYRIYQYTGDTDFLRESAPYLLKYLCYMESKSDEKGLYHYGLGDWCHVHLTTEAMNDHLKYTDTMICKDICDKAAQIFTLIGNTKSAAHASSLSNKIKEAFRKKCISGKFIRLRNQTVQAMGIYYNMMDPEEVREAEQHLETMIHSYNDHFDVGVLGNRVIFRVLAEHGAIDLALKMILDPTFPSYKNHLDLGATSLFESFVWLPHRIDELRSTDPAVNSLNHHFWGDITAFFYRHLAGIQIDSIDHVTIAPCFNSYMNRVRASCTVLENKISVEYKKTDIMVELTANIPASVQGEVKIPFGYRLVRGKLSCRTGENHLIFCKI